ncbi:MAG: hypothetical protein NTV08_18910 [Verrucomicrobia bacterium]|nr:hypothetical protein [Verrucomicrobiota bacterium]
MNRHAFLFTVVLLALMCAAAAATSNGNEFALAMSEAKAPAARKAVLDDAMGRPHFFRYLQIMEMQPVTEDGRAGFKITAFEPSSYTDVIFTVTMPVSLSILKTDPATKVGDAIAVTGKIVGIDPGKNGILLGETIVRHKDRMSPKVGKELLGEVNPGATFYSYTEGPRPIKLEFRDRDLLQSRDKIMAAGGPKAWVEFLETEIAKRKQQRAAAAKEGGQR